MSPHLFLGGAPGQVWRLWLEWVPACPQQGYAGLAGVGEHPYVPTCH